MAAIMLICLGLGTTLAIDNENYYSYTYQEFGDQFLKFFTVWSENTVDNSSVVYGYLYDKKPSWASSPPMTVSCYFSIENTVEIKTMDIEFRVTKSWLDTIKISENDVVLLEYAGSWVEHPTSLKEAGETYYTYSSSSSGLSLFAVGGRSAELQSPLLPVMLFVAAVLAISIVYWFVVRPRRFFVSLKKLERDTGEEIVRGSGGKIEEESEQIAKMKRRTKPQTKNIKSGKDAEILRELKKKAGKRRE